MSEYRAQKTDLAVRKSSLIGAVFLVPLAYLFVAILLNRYVTMPYWQPDLEILSDRAHALQEYGESVTTIFVGSSAVASAVSPRVFDEHLQAQGITGQSFDLVAESPRIPLQLHNLDTIIELQLPELRYVVVQPIVRDAILMWPPERTLSNMYAARNRYTWDFDRSLLAAKVRMGSNRPLLHRLAGSASILFMWLVHESNLGVMADLVAPSKVDPRRVDAAWEDRGSMLYNWGDENSDYSVLPSLQEGARVISEAEIDVVRVYVEKIRAAGAEPVFLFPPTRKAVGERVALRNAVAEAFPNIVLLDYLPDTRPLDLYFDRQFWGDARHLSGPGAIELSQTLADDWASIMTETANEAR